MEINLAAVERRRDRLFDRYGDVPVHERRFTPDDEEHERVLLVLNRGSSKWGLPGGGHEDDETFEEIARREIDEEVGVAAAITELGHLRHETATCDGYDERLHGLPAFFHADDESGSIAIQSGELQGAV